MDFLTDSHHALVKKGTLPALKEKVQMMMGSTLASLIATQSEASSRGDIAPLWFVHIDDRFLEDSFQDILQNKLTDAERVKVNKFMFVEDRKRALLSILLQHALIQDTFHFTSPTDYTILRSKENKPYLHVQRSEHKAEVARWNYNVSHHGKFVGIASHRQALVGLDIVDTKTRSQGITDVQEYVTMFSAQLTDYELSAILSEDSEEHIYDMFFLFWSLKEAFIKAIGQGLGYNLKNAEFTIHPSTEALLKGRKVFSGTATVKIQGQARPDWRFEYFSLDDQHVATVGEGPFCDALPSFAASVWGAEDHQHGLRSSSPAPHKPLTALSLHKVDVRSLCKKIHPEA